LKKYLSSYLFLFSIAGLMIFLDQFTKGWVRTNVPSGSIYMPDFWLTPFARIMNWHNSGAALGLLQGFGGVITVLSFVVSIAIIYYFPQIPSREWTLRLSMSLLLGGAVGNVLDRLYQGYVTDFISIWRLPVFNIADLCITSGVVILALGMLLDEIKKRKPNEEFPTKTEPEPPSLPDAPVVTETEESQGG
jgi:signal peptidase II